MSWGVGLGLGYEPGLYSYNPADVPAGITEATLDFKIWVKKIAGVNCYFTEKGTGRKFVLTVYRDRKTERYRIQGSELDFTDCPLGRTYTVTVKANGKGRMVFEHVGLKDQC